MKVNGRVYIPLISNPLTITPSANKNQSYCQFSQSYTKAILQRSLYKITCSNFLKHQVSLHTVLPSHHDITISQYTCSSEAMTLWPCHSSQPGTTTTCYWEGHTAKIITFLTLRPQRQDKYWLLTGVHILPNTCGEYYTVRVCNWSAYVKHQIRYKN